MGSGDKFHSRFRSCDHSCMGYFPGDSLGGHARRDRGGQGRLYLERHCGGIGFRDCSSYCGFCQRKPNSSGVVIAMARHSKCCPSLDRDGGECMELLHHRKIGSIKCSYPCGSWGMGILCSSGRWGEYCLGCNGRFCPRDSRQRHR